VRAAQPPTSTATWKTRPNVLLSDYTPSYKSMTSSAKWEVARWFVLILCSLKVSIVAHRQCASCKKEQGVKRVLSKVRRTEDWGPR